MGQAEYGAAVEHQASRPRRHKRSGVTSEALKPDELAYGDEASAVSEEQEAAQEWAMSEAMHGQQATVAKLNSSPGCASLFSYNHCMADWCCSLAT